MSEDKFAKLYPHEKRLAAMRDLGPGMFEALECIQRTIRGDELLALDHELAAHADAIDTLLRPIRDIA